MAELVLDWSLLGSYGTSLADNGGGVSATVDTGGVAVDISFDAATESAQAFTFNAEGYVAPGETFSATSFLKLFGDVAGSGETLTSTTVLDFRSSDTALYTDQVQNVSFRLNDIDTGTTEDEGVAGSGWEDIVEINAFDAAGNPVSVTITPGGEIDVVGDELSGTGDGGYTSAENSALVEITGPVARIEFVYSNGDTSSQRVLLSDIEFETVDVTDATDPVAADDAGSTIEGTAVTIDVRGNDTDPDNATTDLVVTAVGTPLNGTAAIAGDGSVTYTPDAGFTGTDTFTYTITDPDGNTDTATVTVEVTADPGGDPVAVDDTGSTFVATPVTIDVLANDTDPDTPLTDLTVSAVGTPLNGTAAIATDGTVTYTPDAGFSGTDTFTYTVTDPEGNTDTGSVTVTVGTDPDPGSDPVAVDDTGSTAVATPVTIDVRANDTDADTPLTDLTVTAVGTPLNGTAAIAGDGTVTYTPDAGFTGTDTFTYTITDPGGNSDTGSVTVTVSADPNGDPVAVDDAASTPIGTAVTIEPLVNDTDPDGDALTIDAIGTPLNGSAVLGTDPVTGAQTVTYTPDAGFTGTDTISYTVSDGNGGSDTGTITVSVGLGNTDPDAVDDLATTAVGTPVTIDVTGNDTDADGDTLTPTSVTDPVNGSAVINGDGDVVYTPDAGFTGTDTFTYTISDGAGGEDTATVTVTVGDDAAPVANPDSATTAAGTETRIYVLGNDTDPDAQPLTLVSASDPANGTAVVNTSDNTVSYTPDAGFTGTDTFTYVVTDPDGNTDTATVTVVVGDNGEPVAADDTASVTPGASTTITVLSNDTDPDGDALTVTISGAPTNGTAVVNADGTVTYTPTAGFTGADSFEYTVTDPAGATDTATVAVTVGDNGAPVANDDTATTDLGTPVTIDPTANDTDPDGDDLTVTAVGTPTNGTATIVTDPTTGTPVVLYTPDDGFTGDDTIPYTVSDGNGGFDTGEIVVTVSPDANDEIDADIFPVDPADQLLDPFNGFDEDADPLNNVDVVNGTSGADTISTGDDADIITAGAGDDVVDPGIDDDFVSLGGGDDSVFDIQGADTILGGDGNDTIIAGFDTIPVLTPDAGVLPGLMSDYEGDSASFELGNSVGNLLNGVHGFTADPNQDDGRDSIQGNNGDDLISTGDDRDTIDAGQGDDTVDGGIDDDFITGNRGNDSLLGGHGSDTIDGGADDDYIDGSNIAALELTDDIDVNTENDRDMLIGALGNDTLIGGDDDDTLMGGSGNDLLDGGIDEDSLIGGNGDDTLIGGQGDDILYGGMGLDSIDGGADADVIVVNSAAEADGETVFGGSTGNDQDTLDMSLAGVRGEDWRIVDAVTDSDGNGLDGTVEFLNDDRAVIGSMDFFNIETIVPCFTPGTLIATPQGERLVEDLQVGDRVITRDNGIQEIRWVGRKDLTGFDLARKPHMKPILIQKGALGNNLPEHDMLVSPNHRVLVANDKTALYFEEREVLVAAKHLTGLDGVDEVEANGVAYIHFMFDQHEVVLSNGAWTESFQPGDYTLRGIGNAQRQEIFELFPELEHAEGLNAYGSARRSLKKHEAALLVGK